MTAPQTDLLVQHSRRQLWVALFLVVALGTAALLMLGFPGKAASAGQYLMLLYPQMIAAALLSLRRSKRALAASAAQTQAVVDDELRQHALNRAWRNGFLVVLLGQPLLALFVSGSGSPHPVALLAGATALAGVVTVLASVLYHDR